MSLHSQGSFTRPRTPYDHVPLHSPHQSISSSRSFTPGELSVHEYRRLQSTPVPLASLEGRFRSVRRRPAASGLNVIERLPTASEAHLFLDQSDDEDDDLDPSCSLSPVFPDFSQGPPPVWRTEPPSQHSLDQLRRIQPSPLPPSVSTQTSRSKLSSRKPEDLHSYSSFPYFARSSSSLLKESYPERFESYPERRVRTFKSIKRLPRPAGPHEASAPRVLSFRSRVESHHASNSPYSPHPPLSKQPTNSTTIASQLLDTPLDPKALQSTSSISLSKFPEPPAQFSYGAEPHSSPSAVPGKFSSTTTSPPNFLYLPPDLTQGQQRSPVSESRFQLTPTPLGRGGARQTPAQSRPEEARFSPILSTSFLNLSTDYSEGFHHSPVSVALSQLTPTPFGLGREREASARTPTELFTHSTTSSSTNFLNIPNEFAAASQSTSSLSLSRFPPPPSGAFASSSPSLERPATALLPSPIFTTGISALGRQPSRVREEGTNKPLPPIPTSPDIHSNSSSPSPPTSVVASTGGQHKPAVLLHYRGASFDLVNPHHSLLISGIETPLERDLDAEISDYFGSQPFTARLKSHSAARPQPAIIEIQSDDEFSEDFENEDFLGLSGVVGIMATPEKFTDARTEATNGSRRQLFEDFASAHATIMHRNASLQDVSTPGSPECPTCTGSSPARSVGRSQNQEESVAVRAMPSYTSGPRASMLTDDSLNSQDFSAVRSATLQSQDLSSYQYSYAKQTQPSTKEDTLESIYGRYVSPYGDQSYPQSPDTFPGASNSPIDGESIEDPDPKTPDTPVGYSFHARVPIRVRTSPSGPPPFPAPMPPPAHPLRRARYSVRREESNVTSPNYEPSYGDTRALLHMNTEPLPSEPSLAGPADQRGHLASNFQFPTPAIVQSGQPISHSAPVLSKPVATTPAISAQGTDKSSCESEVTDLSLNGPLYGEEILASMSPSQNMLVPGPDRDAEDAVCTRDRSPVQDENVEPSLDIEVARGNAHSKKGHAPKDSQESDNARLSWDQVQQQRSQFSSLSYLSTAQSLSLAHTRASPSMQAMVVTEEDFDEYDGEWEDDLPMDSDTEDEWDTTDVSAMPSRNNSSSAHRPSAFIPAPSSAGLGLSHPDISTFPYEAGIVPPGTKPASRQQQVSSSVYPVDNIPVSRPELAHRYNDYYRDEDLDSLDLPNETPHMSGGRKRTGRMRSTSYKDWMTKTESYELDDLSTRGKSAQGGKFREQLSSSPPAWVDETPSKPQKYFPGQYYRGSKADTDTSQFEDVPLDDIESIQHPAAAAKSPNHKRSSTSGSMFRNLILPGKTTTSKSAKRASVTGQKELRALALGSVTAIPQPSIAGSNSTRFSDFINQGRGSEEHLIRPITRLPPPPPAPPPQAVLRPGNNNAYWTTPAFHPHRPVPPFPARRGADPDLEALSLHMASEYRQAARADDPHLYEHPRHHQERLLSPAVRAERRRLSCNILAFGTVFFPVAMLLAAGHMDPVIRSLSKGRVRNTDATVRAVAGAVCGGLLVLVGATTFGGAVALVVVQAREG